jgi:opacity protein-like surface antigen
VKSLHILAFFSFAVTLTPGMSQSPNALGARNVQDYFQDVESKSYYQQERIRSMKGEMNEYSERLHGLQERFHKIFYGSSTNELHQSPFGDKERIAYPARKYRKPIPQAEVEAIVRRPAIKSATESNPNQLAFTVNQSNPLVEEEVRLAEQPQTSFRDEREINPPAEPRHLSASNKAMGGYLILRPGVAIPYRGKKSYQGSSKVKHREYNPGLVLSLTGGYRWGGWKIGAGLLYRKHEHDSGSYEQVGAAKYPFAAGSDAMTIAGFLDTGYTYTINQWFGLYGSLGLGYGVTAVEDFAPLFSGSADRTRLDPFFFASLGVGATWTPSEYFALSIGYRYLHEKEAPAHAVELGIEGRF